MVAFELLFARLHAKLPVAGLMTELGAALMLTGPGASFRAGCARVPANLVAFRMHTFIGARFFTWRTIDRAIVLTNVATNQGTCTFLLTLGV